MAKATSKKVLNNVIAEETKATPKTKGVKKSANKAPGLTKATLTAFGEYCAEYVKGEKHDITKEQWESFAMAEKLDNVKQTAYNCYIAVGSLMNEREKQGLKEVDRTQLDLCEKVTRENMGAWFRLLGVRPPRKDGGKNRPLYSVTEADFALLGEMFAQCKVDDDTIGTAENVFYMLVGLSGRIINGEPLPRLTEGELKADKKARNAAKAKKAKETKEKNAKAKAEKEKAETDENETTPKGEFIEMDKLIAYATEKLSAEQAEQLVKWAKENAVKF